MKTGDFVKIINSDELVESGLGEFRESVWEINQTRETKRGMMILIVPDGKLRGETWYKSNDCKLA